MTELLPLMFPMELSAVFSPTAACLLAKVSGILVPKATRVMAVILSFKSTRHPNKVARSPIMAVMKPITAKDRIKAGHPPRYFGGGTNAKRICKMKHLNIVAMFDSKTWFDCFPKLQS